MSAVEAIGARRAEFVAYARRRVGSEADAEDVVSEALVRAAAKVGTLRDAARARAWFYRVLRRTLADHRARVRTEAARAAALDPEAVPAAPAPDGEACACGLGLLAAMPAPQAELVRRVDLEDEPVGLAARALGITPNAASVRLHRARKSLRAQLEACCGGGTFDAYAACACPTNG